MLSGVETVFDSLLEAGRFNEALHPRGLLGRWIAKGDKVGWQHPRFGAVSGTVEQVHDDHVTVRPHFDPGIGGSFRVSGPQIRSVNGGRAREETTAEEIARKSPGAQADLARYKSVLAGSQAKVDSPDEKVDIGRPAIPGTRAPTASERAAMARPVPGPPAGFVRTVDGRSISLDAARREQSDYMKAHGKPSPYIPTHIAPTKEPRVSALNPRTPPEAIQAQMRLDRAEIGRQKIERSRRIRNGTVVSESVMGCLLESIGPIEKGAFHRWLGKKQDEPITDADIAKGLAAGGHPAKDGCVREGVSEVLEVTGVLGALLEGFSADQGPVVLDGRVRPGDRVRVDVKGSDSIVGRVVRPSDAHPATHVLVAPEGGGPHVETTVKTAKHDSPERHGREVARRAAERETEAQVAAQAAVRPVPGEKPGPVGAAAKREGVLEAFIAGGGGGAGGGSAGARPLASAPGGAGGYVPRETPAQSRSRAAGMVAQAKAGIADFNAKHPRGGHGRFSKKGGATSTSSKRASRAAPGGARILAVGSKGTLVRSIQRQLHLPATGTYDARTQAAIERYQRQHGLLVDGKVGAQTIASLRGNPRARTIKPGPIPASTARVHSPRRATKATAHKGGQPLRVRGGIVI